MQQVVMSSLTHNSSLVTACRDGDIPRAVIHKTLKYAEVSKYMLLCVLGTELDNLIQIQLRILAVQQMKSP